jgi:unsaturated rhamnogalacturonyl hydrolase
LRLTRILAIATLAFLCIGRASADETDWGRAVADSTMRQNPSAAEVPWRYPRALYMLGQYRLYRRTGDSRYLRYVEDWGEAHVDDEGNMYFDGDRTQPVPLPSHLDHLLAGRIVILLHQETGKSKFRLAADKLRRALDTWPRTSDGGLWHMVEKPDQLWLDGTYMVLPFLVEYGAAFGDSAYANQEAAAQLLIYARHLRDPATGLLYHAYDERGAARWADPATRRSPAFWCRSIGWYGMALVDVLDHLPVDDPRRPSLVAILGGLAAALQRY